MLVITTMLSTKEKILMSALKLFSQKGYLGTTTKDIAREANIAEITLFRYFPTKEKLFKEVLMSKSFIPTLREFLSTTENMEYRIVLNKVADYYIKLLRQKRDLIRIIHGEIFQYPKEIKEIQSKIMSELYLTFANYLESMKNKRLIRDIDTESAAMGFFGSLFNLFIKKEIFNKKINLKKNLAVFLDIFYEGTRRK